jgi:AhpD family alkylhydroperoxidase
MQVIPLVDVQDLPPDLRDMVQRWEAVEDGDPNFIRTLGNSPDMLRRFVPFYSPVIRKGVVEHRTKELVRINIAEHNQCKYCMATRYGSGRRSGIDEALVGELADYENGPFSERERTALAYSDQLVFDLPEVPLAVVQRLQKSFTGEEILELTWAICLWIETGRLYAALGVPYGADAPSGLVPLALS